MNTVARLDWIDALRSVPASFTDNGCSSPFKRFHALYPHDVQHAIGIAARFHDWGFGPARLPGSGFEAFGRADWNAAYRECLTDQGHKVIATVHFAGLAIGSRGPWNRSLREMDRAGWHCYLDFLTATEPAVAAYRVTMQAAWADA